MYHGGQELQRLQNEAFALFSLANPLHADTFPFVRKMEAEIVAMTIELLDGTPNKQQGIYLTVTY